MGNAMTKAESADSLARASRLCIEMATEVDAADFTPRQKAVLLARINVIVVSIAWARAEAVDTAGARAAD